ncbi:CheR family methyltransferase [Pareuzebyella sediminis]|uniref:CheR family methyltransferase n=1 Tax=Pareuzebyella sediminis TaxID=2607998 RepID=UPI0011EBA8E5|nr:CheR family methyltransferase [Pareuzebyella sediminis]
MAESKTSSKKNRGLYVVGVGASAGGLDAITKLLSNFNGVTANFCVVVVMHLSPKYKSELTSILNKRCKWPVITVESNLELKPRHIYVTPQNSDIHIEGTDLMLAPLPPNYSTAPSIDNFFTSLARSRQNKAVGIILSGYGKDGSEGIIEIKKNNGFTLAQYPDTAEHPDMPKAAIQTKMVDLVIPPEQMFEEVSHFILNSTAIAASPPKKKSIDAIFELLEKRSGTDFSQYKPTTIMRRINHRMAGLQIGSLIKYYELIMKSPRELDFLFKTVLIGVTEFFRDKKAFDSFRKLLEDVLKQKSAGDSIRIWCVGCASGEEPYSVAIMLNEILQEKINHHQIQIFASDIDERGLNIGRKGIYSKESLENLDPNLISKYFETDDGIHYEVNKQIKQHILFTRHDISNDPPFVKLDALICRNLLIYFNNALQKQSFQIFHYSLRPHGLLFLGKSESVSVAADLFEKIDTHKIFRKAEAALSYQLRFSRFRGKNDEKVIESKKAVARNMSIVDVAKETLYHKYDHPFVIINEQAEIKQVHGSVRMYLEIKEGTMNANLYKMANPELNTVLKAVHAQVKKTKVPHTSHVVKFMLYENPHYVKIKITPLLYTVADSQYYLVIFEKIMPSEQVLELQKKLQTADFVDLRIKELEDELATKSEHLQIFTEELEATNEELQTINEELQSANEELKSSNEELETSNEELQSANEELNTANNELRLTNELMIEKEAELKREKSKSDQNELIYRTIAENIPNGTVGILNENFKIEYVAGTGLDDLGAEDMIGQSMPELNPSRAETERLRKLCQQTLEGKSGHVEVHYKNRYYEVQTVPVQFRSEDKTKILYLVQEITEEKKNLLKLDAALHAAKLVVVEYDFEKDLIAESKSLCQLLDIGETRPLKEKDFVGKIHPEDLKNREKQLKKAFKTGRIAYDVRLVLKEGIKHMRVSGKILFDDEKKPISAVSTLLDITQDKELLFQVKESEERFKRIAESAPVTIWITDKEDNCTYINKTWLEYTGSSLEDCLNDGWLKYIHPEDRRRSMKTFLKASDKRIPFELEYMVKNKDGSYGWFLNRAHPIFDQNDQFNGFIGTNVDITAQKKFSEALEKEVAERTSELEMSNAQLMKVNLSLEEYAHITSHDLQEPVRKIRTFNSMLRPKIDDNEAAVKLVDRIESSAERMTSLIKDILEYSKVSEGNVDFDTVDLDDVVQKIEQDLELLISENEVTINSDNLGSIEAVPTQIYQLFSNLIKNSIKFNDNKPKITIKSSEIQGKDLDEDIDVFPDLIYKKLLFIDNGIGIAEAQRDKIFKPFQRLHSKTAYSGTGIGLSLCRRIAEIHKGHIRVGRNSGSGAIFEVYLPIQLQE